MSRRRRKILLLSLIPVVLGIFVVANLKRSSEKRVEVRLEEAKRRDLTQIVRATGKVASATEVNLSGTIMGQVVEVAVREGDTVEKGQFLLRLDDTQYRAYMNQAEAALASAEASLRLAQAQCDLATQTADRKRSLHAKRLASDEEMERTEAELRAQVATCDARERDVARLRAEVRAAADNLAKTSFHAPVGGVVSRLNVEVGENVITGTMNNPGTVILTVADLSAMEVRADVDETDVVRVLVGQRARLRVDALPDTSFPGTVTEVASAGKRTGAGVDEATDFEVTVRFDEPVREVRPEMTAEVEITTAERDSVLSVPISAVVARDRKDLTAADGKDKKDKKDEKEEASESEESESGSAKRRADLVVGVFVVDGQRARFLPVRTGISDDHHTEILDAALEPGSKVIVGPYAALRTLKPGKAVKPAKKDSSGSRRS